MYSQPSGLTGTWHLKYTVTLQSPPAHAHKDVSNIIVSAVLSFLHTWAGCLLSIASWAQLACLSGYPQSTVLRALHSAVPRIISRTPWDVDSTLQWCCHVVYVLPATCDTIFFRLRRWLQAHAVRTSAAYASWHMPHPGPCSNVCADWCYDFPVLSSFTPFLDPCELIRSGLCPRGEGGHGFPLYVKSIFSPQLRSDGTSLDVVHNVRLRSIALRVGGLPTGTSVSHSCDRKVPMIF